MRNMMTWEMKLAEKVVKASFSLAKTPYPAKCTLLLVRVVGGVVGAVVQFLLLLQQQTTLQHVFTLTRLICYFHLHRHHKPLYFVYLLFTHRRNILNMAPYISSA